MDLKLALTAPERRLRRDYVYINSVFGSQEDGATCGVRTVQWRHHVMMRVTMHTLVDQDSRNFTSSTCQLCICSLVVQRNGCVRLHLCSPYRDHVGLTEY